MGTPLEIGYKLLLNNLYGKTIQHPIMTENKFIKGEEAMKRYRVKNYQKINCYTLVAGSDDIYNFEIKKSSTTDSYNNCVIGSLILAMSKRIMNEVMCLAEDNNWQMYYQDTDSFFIKESDYKKLKNEFKKVYGRELEGKELGQFHPDFISRDERTDVKYATESLFIRKKLYCWKLLMKDGSENITFRCKGISPKALEITAQKRYPELTLINAIWKTYMDLYEGETIEINLCDGAPVFKFHKDTSISTEASFFRKINRGY
jgi:hypothetical protein